MLHLIIHPN